jgi:glycosyltransferase involved in cell wall biosynthesis
VVLLVSGDITRRTGGNLYDRHMERACRGAGLALRIVSVRSTAQARSALVRLRPRVIVIDSIAIPMAAPIVHWAHETLHARVIALMHMPTTARGAHGVLREADRVVAVSLDLARTLARSGVPRSRIRVIQPGSDGVPLAPRRAASSRGARDAELADGSLRVLCVANWTPTKGIATLVAAAAHVPEVRVDLVGDVGTGSYRDSVMARIRSSRLGARVVIHGALGQRALAQRYARADVFALPTEREGYGIVFAEALKHGLPVIAGDIRSARSVVGDAGVYVPPRRVRPLVAALRLMTDPWLRRRLARYARVSARALPRWTTSRALFVALVRNEMDAAVARR